MRGSIKLDNQTALRTIKVDNVRTYAELPPESLSFDLTLLQVRPKHGFRRSAVSPQFSTILFETWVVGD